MTAQLDAPSRRSGGPGDSPSPPVAPAQLTAAAQRRVSRKSLALAVLVVLLGGILAYTAAQMLTTRTEVLAVARDVEAGATLTADDFVVANVTEDPALTPVSATDLASVIGMTAQVPMNRGELLTRSQFGPGAGIPSGEVLVALPLQNGQFPARGLTAGQEILVVATPGTAGATPGQTPVAVAEPIDATVAEVGAVDPATQVTVVDVRVAESDGVDVAALASTGNLAVIVLAGNA